MARLSRLTASPTWWTAIACTLLFCSAGIRQWRDLQFAGKAKESETCPFPLSEIPRDLGTWHSDEREDERLDPEIADLAGSSGHTIRIYKDNSTGEAVSALVLYGLATSVFAHIPDVCYRSAGFQPAAPPTEQPITVPDWPNPVRYRTLYFKKKIGGVTQYTEVNYTFLHNGAWLPEVSSRWKMFRYHPGMFKIQIERHVAGVPIESSPSPALLGEFVKVINRHVAEVRAREEEAKRSQGR